MEITNFDYYFSEEVGIVSSRIWRLAYRTYA